MGDFERAICNAFNNHFKQKGVAYRHKQSKYTEQWLDVLIDNPFLGIECKSIDVRKTKKLYFTQHFSKTDNGHQIPRITRFLKKAGRTGYLALEARRGRGKTKAATLLPWKPVKQAYQKQGVKGLKIKKIFEQGTQLKRKNAEYRLTNKIINLLPSKQQ